MMQQRMHCAPRRTHCDNQNVSDGENIYLSKKYTEEEKSITTSKVSEISSASSDERCPLLTFVTPEPDGNWKLVAVPLQFFENMLGSRSQVTMDGLHMLPPQPINSFKDGRGKTSQLGPLNAAASIRSFSARNFPAPDVRHQPRSKTLTNDITKTEHRFSNKSICRGSSIPNGLNGIDSNDDIIMDDSWGKKVIKKTKRKKGRKKGKQSRKSSLCDHTYPNEQEVLSEGYTVESSICETIGKTSSFHKERLLPDAYSDVLNGFEGDKNDVVYSSESSKRNGIMSYINKVDVSEAITLSVENLGKEKENHAMISEIDVPFDQKVIIFDESFERTHRSVARCCDGHDEMDKDGTVEPSQKPYVFQNGGVDIYTGKKRSGTGCLNDNDLQVVGLAKKGKETKGVTKNISVIKNGSLNNSVGSTGKENNHVWQKVQKNKGIECEAKLTKENSCAQFDVKKGEPKQCKDKTITKLPKKFSPSSKQEINGYHTKGFQFDKVGSDGNGKVSTTQKKELLLPIGALLENPKGLIDESKAQESEDNPLKKSNNMVDEQCLVYFPNLPINKVSQMEKQLSCSEIIKQTHVMQKWIPVGIRGGLDMASPMNQGMSSSLEYSGTTNTEDWVLRSNAEENVSCMGSQNHHACVSKTQTMSATQSSVNSNCSTQDDESQGSSNGNKNRCRRFEGRIISPVETDLSPITRAVNDACRVQVASEAVQMAIGCPVAEFERLLYFSAPVIRHSNDLWRCKTCLRDRNEGSSNCKHEGPNISLSCLWEWYEKHGSYGLEVKAEDYNKKSKKTGVHDRFAFRAYYVPYLSAVQLFKTQKINSMQNQTMYESTTFCHLLDEACKPELYSDFLEESSSIQFVDTPPCPDYREVLFEYFETDQPQRRLSLYDKIQELVRGDPSSQYKMYGDATSLNSLNLHEIDPESWYSVAWYPIYRIPDGNLRAAFLTYHSLGHVVGRTTKSSTPTIVSPVVGLQSYNDQGECWFRPRNSDLSRKAEEQGLNPSVILKERLRTLEETACRMARGVVKKGNERCVNRHPDYEFFLARQR